MLVTFHFGSYIPYNGGEFQTKARELLEEEQLISLKEAAARSRLSSGFLRRLCRLGRIRATKVGRDWVTTWRAVAEYLEDAEKRSKDPLKYKKT